MADNFNEALKRTLINEGGLVDDPDDPGGLTKYGISKRAWPHLDIANLTLPQAKAIYRQSYWLANGCQLIQNRELACKLFDLCVNIGGVRAVKMLQLAISSFGVVLDIDGILGPVTASAANDFIHQQALLMALRVIAGQHYLNQNRSDYLAGWLSRLAR